MCNIGCTIFADVNIFITFRKFEGVTNPVKFLVNESTHSLLSNAHINLLHII